MIGKGSLDEEFVKILEVLSGQKIVDNFIGKEADKLLTKLRKKNLQKTANTKKHY